MALRHHNGPYVLILALALLVLACRQEEQQPLPKPEILEATPSTDSVNRPSKKMPVSPKTSGNRSVRVPTAVSDLTAKPEIIDEVKDSLPAIQKDSILSKR